MCCVGERVLATVVDLRDREGERDQHAMERREGMRGIQNGKDRTQFYIIIVCKRGNSLFDVDVSLSPACVCF